MPFVADAEAPAEPTGAVPAAPIPKAALVTGGGRRIGRALALTLAEDGFAVAVHYHRARKAAEAVVETIRGKGGAALALGADLGDEDAVRALLPQAERAFGPVGCLINNAGVFGDDTVATATRESWDLHLAVNLRAPFVLIQELAARLPAEAGGAVVNMLDERVWSLTPFFVSYTLSKAGLWALTQTMALALAPRIRVNGIGPGPTLPSPRQSPEQFRQAIFDDAPRPRHQPARDRGGYALHPVGAGIDRANDRARRRTTSRLGSAAADPNARITGFACRANETLVASTRLTRGSCWLSHGGNLFTVRMTIVRHSCKQAFIVKKLTNLLEAFVRSMGYKDAYFLGKNQKSKIYWVSALISAIFQQSYPQISWISSEWLELRWQLNRLTLR